MKRAALMVASLLLALPLHAVSPDRTLLTQNGEPVRFYSDVLKGKVVLISFIFTQCKDVCPLQTQKLAAVQQLLPGFMGHSVHFVSISVDPERDRPEVLREYAGRFNAGPGWTFLTGNKRDIEDVVARLGQAVKAPQDHTSLFIAGNAKTGRWVKLHPDMTPVAIAEQLRNLAAEAT
jgi:protein SCO1